MPRLYSLFLKLILFSTLFIVIYHFITVHKANIRIQDTAIDKKDALGFKNNSDFSLPVIYLWCIVVKIEHANSGLLKKLKIFLKSLLYHSKCSLSLNILTDEKSKTYLDSVLVDTINQTGYGFVEIVFYDHEEASQRIKPIVKNMHTHFSSNPGSYYSDALFYISLGLDQIAPIYHNKIILLDIDMQFRKSVAKLYEYFSEFQEETLFAMAPELSPVYFHILWKWKQLNPDSSFGEPSNKGFSGLNSGVILMNLNAIRNSEEYRACLSDNYVNEIAKKYIFKGHLGDQDFYTLLAMEKPHLFKILPCTWNRQLCQWWRKHGYADVFDEFAYCDGDINIYHGNCNTTIEIN